jgi:hypothetical protein
MKRSFILLLACLLLSGLLYAQSVKQSTSDTSKSRANDRLRTAGPKDGWKNKNKSKIDSIKSKKDTVAVKPRIDSLKKRN